jgi:hypothetical protein
MMVMVRKDGAFIKSQRLITIGREVAKHMPNGVPYDKIIMWIEWNIGLSKVKATEYLDAVIERYDWAVEDGVIKAGLKEKPIE